MRALEPDRLVVLESGLWAIDVFQPVAAVVDPESGAVRRLVAWPELPPAPYESWPEPRALGDGTGLWVQQDIDGPLMRVGLAGPEFMVDTGGTLLTASGPGAAWCAPASPEQVLVESPLDPRASANLARGRLLRVDAMGTKTEVRTPTPVLWVHGGLGALWVLVQTEQVILRAIGGPTLDVRRESTWLSLPWDAEIPPELTFDEHHAPDGPPSDEPTGVWDGVAWYVAPDEDDRWGRVHGTVMSAGLQWRLGWPTHEEGDDPIPSDSTQWSDSTTWRVVVMAGSDHEPVDQQAEQDSTWRQRDGRVEARKLIATAHDARKQTVHRFDLGQGMVSSVEPVDGGIAVSVRRASDPDHESRVEVVRLDGATGGTNVLLAGGSVDIGSYLWPLVERPDDADEHAEQERLRCLRFTGLVAETSRAVASISGEWPETEIVVVFPHSDYPGLLLRRRWRLYDELGRHHDLDFIDVHLEEDLATGMTPPISAARDGILDI